MDGAKKRKSYESSYCVDASGSQRHHCGHKRHVDWSGNDVSEDASIVPTSVPKESQAGHTANTAPHIIATHMAAEHTASKTAEKSAGGK